MRARGPKNWRRPDERILDELGVSIALSGVDAREVSVAVRQGEVWLDGFVAGPRARRFLEELAGSILGVVRVHSDLHVPGEAWPQAAAPVTRH